MRYNIKLLIFFIIYLTIFSTDYSKELFTKELIFQKNLIDLKIKNSSFLITSCGFNKTCFIKDNILNIQNDKSKKITQIELPSKKAHHLIHHENYLYLSDTILNNILKIDLESKNLEWIFPDQTTLNFPKEIAIHKSNSDLFIADYGNLKVKNFNSNNQEVKFFLYRDKNSNELAAPLSICIYQNFLYALYPAEQKLVKFHLKSTEILEEHDLSETKIKLFSKASQINVDLYGFLYIFDKVKESIFVFNQKFELQDKLLNSSYFYPNLSNIESFNIDALGNLYLQTKNTVYSMKIKDEELKLQNLKYHYKNSELKVIINEARLLLKDYPQNKLAREYLLEALELQSAEYIRSQNWDMASFTLKETLKISPSHKSTLKKLRIISFKKNRTWIIEIFLGVSLLMIFLLATYTTIEYIFSKPKDIEE